METLSTSPQPVTTLQILTVDINLVPLGADKLDLYCRRFEAVRRGWKFVLTPEELGRKVRFRIHTTFAADVPYELKSLKIMVAGTPKPVLIEGTILTLDLLAADDELQLVELIAVPKAANKPKRRGGGNLIIRDAGGGN